MKTAIITLLLCCSFFFGGTKQALANDLYYELGYSAYTLNDFAVAKRYFKMYLESVPDLEKEYPAFFKQIQDAIETCEQVVKEKGKGSTIIEVEASAKPETGQLDIK